MKRVRPLDPTRPTAREAVAEIHEHAKWHDHERGGCGVHCQVDDGNIGDRFFDAESRAAAETYGPACLRLFDVLAKLSTTQRRKAIAIAMAET